jgi:hypothetical protein
LRKKRALFTKSLANQIRTRSPNIRGLSLSRCNIRKVLLNHFPTTNLEELHLSFCFLSHDWFDLTNGTEEGERTVSSGQSGYLLPLQYLHLIECSGIDNCGIRMICDNFKQLSNLALSHCDFVSDTAFEYISENLKELKVLKVALCRFTDEGISWITNGLKQLEVLEIS